MTFKVLHLNLLFVLFEFGLSLLLLLLLSSVNDLGGNGDDALVLDEGV